MSKFEQKRPINHFLSAEDIRLQAELQELNFRCIKYVDKFTPNPTIDPDTWLEIGLRTRSINNEISFCDKSLLQEVFSLRSSLDNRHEQQVSWARSRANLFEVNAGNFMTRAAIKIANVDSMFGWKLCQLSGGDELDQLFYFVDVFGGPGGCSEYVLWRNNGWNAKGFGYTPKGDYEFCIDKFRMAAPDSFDPFYGANDDAHIFEPKNLSAFIEYVRAQTDDKLGAHLIMCDGGFYVKNNNQELISKQLYLCLVLLAVGIIRPGGNAILKVFDLYTPFSVGLVYILTKCYGEISIVKPISSRPANSERYIVCQNRLNKDDIFMSYLYSINQVLWENRNNEHDIVHIISPQTLKRDVAFYNFICNSNNDLARRQISGLKSLIDLLEGTSQQEKIDKFLVKETLWRMWKLDQGELESPMDDIELNTLHYALKLIDSDTLEIFAKPDTLLCGNQRLEGIFENPHDWQFAPIDVTVDQGKNIRAMILSKGNGKVFFYYRSTKSWKIIEELQLILSPRTLLYGEIVQEITYTDDKQRVDYALHIIDAIMIGGRDVRSLPLVERNTLCNKFARAMNRPIAHRNYSSIRPIPVFCKQLMPMINFETFFSEVSIYKLPNGTNVLGCDVERFDSQESKKFFIPRGLLFFRNAKYKLNNVSRRQHFGNTYTGRVLWTWANTSQIYSSTEMIDVTKEPDLIYRQDLQHFIEKYEQFYL